MKFARYGDVIFQVPFGLGVMLVSLVVMSDFAKAKLSTWFDGAVYLALFGR